MPEKKEGSCSCCNKPGHHTIACAEQTRLTKQATATAALLKGGFNQLSTTIEAAIIALSNLIEVCNQLEGNPQAARFEKIAIDAVDEFQTVHEQLVTLGEGSHWDCPVHGQRSAKESCCQRARRL